MLQMRLHKELNCKSSTLAVFEVVQNFMAGEKLCRCTLIPFD